jgi:hypothetical protein
MSDTSKIQGACVFCGSSMSRGGMSRHLSACGARKEAVRAADEQPGDRETLLHMLVQDAGSGDFWLHLEMRGGATLKKLDAYLRTIWLECCGHLSQFSRGEWSGQTMGMARRVEDVLGDGGTLTHVYDFGSSSVTLVKAVDTRQGRPLTKHPILLMARNKAPARICQDCGEPATRLCLECVYETDTPFLCEAHAASHPHDDYGEPMPLVNSPRLGICGYDGPAEPPY